VDDVAATARRRLLTVVVPSFRTLLERRLSSG
jgi:hypothetical protein